MSRCNGRECLHIDRVAVRAKSTERFIQKALKIENGYPKYPDPLNQIQDQIGARIVVFYLSDVDVITKWIKGYFPPIEEKDITLEKATEFGYEGKHFILFLPKDIKISGQIGPNFFEMQIVTLFQHAWGEANHDLVYKPKMEPNFEQRKKVAFTAAQAWGVDRIFDELAQELL
jgi:ppGpp synthetase/RelA/SpoT-type nucleotidyltranferase